MATVFSSFTQLNSVLRVPGPSHSVRPIRLRVYNSQDSRTIGPRAKEDVLPNGKVRTDSNNDSMINHTETPQRPNHPPLVNALKLAAEENVAGFHFPGHNRGQAAPPSLTNLIGRRPFLHDLPELPELDNLFAPEGPILEAQKLAAELFGASETWFLVGGTTCGIQAAIMATCCPGDILILPRNAHISAVSAMVLSGAVPKYVFPEYDPDWDIAAAVSPAEVERAIKELEAEGRKPAAVFITCPTYHGICSDLSEISLMCHLHGIPLIVDEAHGAHFGFHSELPSSALQLGADVAVQSTHKVLCSLTQSSMLHLSGKIVDRENIARSLQILQSTSPSYLLLASLDGATAQLRDNPPKVFDYPIRLAVETKNAIRMIPGMSILDLPNFSGCPVGDPLRVTVGFHDLGLSGYEADEFLFEHQRLIPELVGAHSITCAFTPGICGDHVQRLVSGLKHLSSSHLPLRSKKQRPKNADLKPFDDIDINLTPREAFFKKKIKVDIRESIRKVCGELICPYPPGIPVTIPGEVISERCLDTLLQCKAQGGVITGASDPSLSTMVICDV